jgi:hypothetical protein
MKIVRVLSGCVAAAAVTALLLCGGCVSLMEKTGQALDGSAFAEKTVAVYRARRKDGAAADMAIRETRGKAGERSVVITLDEFPTLRLRGSAPNAAGEFFFSSLDYLGGSVSGWNEYRLELSGGGKLSLGETDAVISMPEPPEAVQISEGKIRRYDTRITGTDALTNLRNRRERILALVEWMKEREDAPARDLSAAGNENDFKDYWKPVLFPELVPSKKRPEGWLREGDAKVRAEDIAWNTGYTERLFPESLRAVRNSGTLLRDWEEAFDWIYIEYEWDAIAALLATEITLQKTKK